MKAALQVPSGVLISTLGSTTSRPAAAPDSAVAARPAVTVRATKLRRAISPGCVSFFSWSSIMAALSKSLSLFDWDRFASGSVGEVTGNGGHPDLDGQWQISS